MFGRSLTVASYRLQVLIPGALENRLRKAARRARISKGAWVRRAIEERLERESGGLPSDPLAALREIDAPTADIDVMIAEIEAGRS
ncbi:MAG: antitoxin [Gemmatimonadales bacterium]|nr:antitoxin [Gemmatimonadota bacterium]MYC88883.1 antitoxin [Candidatus Palauibacter denitrificans]